MTRNRPSKHDPQSLSFDTQAVHLGNSIDAGSQAIRTPLVMANSYALPSDGTANGWSGFDGMIYARDANTNGQCLEAKLRGMEGAEDAVVFATGVAALHALFFSYLRSGDHIVVSEVTYEAVWKLFTQLLPERYNITATFVDITDLDAVRAAITPTTRLIHTETIANPTTLVADVAGLAAVAHEHGIYLSVDSTFTPPPIYRPIADGADFVIHSLTKYINGHGDAMGGVVLGKKELLDTIRYDALLDAGAAISPFNAWMINRGAVTLPLRLQRHVTSAQQIAEYLEAHPAVAYVAYPGLESHSGHELAKRQFGDRGFGGVLSFALEGDIPLQRRVVENLEVITHAVSLGHDESLIVFVGPEGRGGWEQYPEGFRTYGHFRLSVGLEDPADLIADLDAAIAAAVAG